MIYGRIPEQLREPETPGSRRRRTRRQVTWLLLLSICVLGLTNGGGKPLSSEERAYLDAVEPLMLRTQRVMMDYGHARGVLLQGVMPDEEAAWNARAPAILQRWPPLANEALALQPPPQRFQEAHLTLMTATSCYAEQAPIAEALVLEDRMQRGAPLPDGDLIACDQLFIRAQAAFVPHIYLPGWGE